MRQPDVDIIIAGGGPVGLYLAGRLIQEGISCKILEKKDEIDLHSKSLGIHPVSLELFEKAGIIEPFLESGLKIKKGLAFWNRDFLGEILFETCPPPYSYILALHQWKTETILESWVQKLNPDVLVRGASIYKMDQQENTVVVGYQQDSINKTSSSRILIGCDGKNSIIRSLCNIEFVGDAYPDCYVMGDFDDSTDFGSDAAVFLHTEGLIESFPLPNRQRRWVVKTDQYVDKPTVSLIKSEINRRINYDLHDDENYMISSFGVQQYTAESFCHKNVLLAGDAAHVVSPIGGQGMNLGWLDAEEAVSVILASIRHSENQNTLFQNYAKQRKKIAKQVARRAEMNMHLGRKESSNLVYKYMLKLVLSTRLQQILAKIFTMRGLGKWWI